MVQAFKAFELQRIESSVSLVLDGHAFAGMEAAGDRNAFSFKIDQFLKVRVVFTARTNGGRLSITFDKLAFGISQSSKARAGESNEQDQGPPSHETIENLLLLSDLDDFGKWEPDMGGVYMGGVYMGGVLSTIACSVQIILW